MNKDPGAQTVSTPTQHFLSWPRTRPGKWAVGLGLAALALPLLTTLFNALILLLSNGNTFALAAAGTLMLLCALAGGVTGLVAVIGRRERSFLVWAVILMGLFSLLVVAHELIFQ